MGLKAFDKLDMDLKKAVIKASREAEDIAWKRSEDRIGLNTKKMTENGITYTAVENVPQELITHLQTTSAPLLAKWRQAMGAEADLILSQYYTTIGR